MSRRTSRSGCCQERLHSSLDRRDPSATELVLDTRDLTISKTEAAIGEGPWVDTPFRLDPATPAFGSALRITMPPGSDRVRVTYSSAPTAKGLQWLTPAQTSGQKHPFLFSQAQAIQARSFIPLQDPPGVRITYDATIRVPKELVAVMAAESRPGQPGTGVFQFTMPQAIPSYLIALAVGDLVFKPMSGRTGVWAEPSVVDAAAREFDDTEAMIEATEKLYGPYRWGRYDLLVLPPSFPFGGMENPRLTFATPTVIAGDKSLVSLVAHELAHSWSGNLVTNATWTDFWLNEGFTTYLERRIVEAVYGKPRADMEALIGVRDLDRQPEDAGRAARSHAPAGPHGPGSGRRVFDRAVRAGRAVPGVPRSEVRPRRLRCVPATVVRRPRLQERDHRHVPGVPQGPVDGPEIRGCHGRADPGMAALGDRAGVRGAADVGCVRASGARA